MQKLKLTNSSHSIDYYAKMLIILLIPILFINFILSFLSISTIHKQNINQMTSSINIYADSLQKELKAVDHFMFWSALHEPSIDEIATSTTHNEYETGLRKLRYRVTDFMFSTNVDWTFLVATTSNHRFTNASALHLDYSVYHQLEDFFNQPEQLKTTSGASNNWEKVSLYNQEYLYRSVHYNEKTIFAVVATKDLLTPLNTIEIGNQGSISTMPPETQSNGFINLLFGNPVLHFNQEETQLPFDVFVKIDYPSAFKNMLFLQVMMLLLPFIIGAFSLFLLFYIQTRVIRPVRRFTDRLIRISKEEPVKLIDEGISEIDNANDQITGMVREMQNLRINVYESELEQKRMELNYLRTQIQPHFYLNILSTIHSMVQTKNYHEIEELTLSTSKYLRYLFQSTQDFVGLSAELAHIENYLAVQKLRYGDSLKTYLHLDHNLADAAIPPLVLQTFIENAVRHSYTVDDNLVIDIDISFTNLAKSHYTITIKDNGYGFPEDVLEKLQSHTSLVTPEGKHVGLTNVRERLDLLYGTKYQLAFKNQQGHGTWIQLIIPYQAITASSNQPKLNT